MRKQCRRLINRLLGRQEADREITMVEWLRQCGAQIGENVDLIEFKCNSKDATCLSIGDNVTCSRTTVLTHDASLNKFLGHDCNKIGRVVIGNNVFIGVETVILPNVHIGNNVIIGAGSVVTRDIPDDSVAAGNPARVIGSCSDYLAKHKKRMEDASLVYVGVDRLAMSAQERETFNREIDGKIVYLVEPENESGDK